LQIQVHRQAAMLCLPGPRSRRRGPHQQYPTAAWPPGYPAGGQGGCTLRAAVSPPSASHSL